MNWMNPALPSCHILPIHCFPGSSTPTKSTDPNSASDRHLATPESTPNWKPLSLWNLMKLNETLSSPQTPPFWNTALVRLWIPKRFGPNRWEKIIETGRHAWSCMPNRSEVGKVRRGTVFCSHIISGISAFGCVVSTCSWEIRDTIKPGNFYKNEIDPNKGPQCMGPSKFFSSDLAVLSPLPRCHRRRSMISLTQSWLWSTLSNYIVNMGPGDIRLKYFVWPYLIYCDFRVPWTLIMATRGQPLYSWSYGILSSRDSPCAPRSIVAQGPLTNQRSILTTPFVTHSSYIDWTLNQYRTARPTLHATVLFMKESILTPNSIRTHTSTLIPTILPKTLGWKTIYVDHVPLDSIVRTFHPGNHIFRVHVGMM